MEATTSVESVSVKATDRAAVESAMRYKAAGPTAGKAGSSEAGSTGESGPTEARPADKPLPDKAPTDEPRTTEPGANKPGPETEAVEPGASADEDASNEPVRAVKAVRRASIWVIVIVAVSAYRSGPEVSGTNANANGNLRVGGHRSRKHADAE